MVTRNKAKFVDVLEAFIILLLVVLPVLPVVDLVDQHRGLDDSGEKVMGTAPVYAPLHLGREGILGNHTHIAERRVETRKGGMGATRTLDSGSWNSISHRQLASSSLQLRSVAFPSAFDMFSDLSSSSSSFESVSAEQEFEQEEQHERRYAKSRPSKQQRHYQHAQQHRSPETKGASISSGSGTGQGNENAPLLFRHHPSSSYNDDAIREGGHRKQLSLPPMPLASSTRVTGPYFDSNTTFIRISTKAGENVFFDCTVILLQGRTVSWLRRGNDSLQLLTVGNITYYNDPRLKLRFRYPNNWRLAIDAVEKGDEGEYQCQLSTHPVKTLIYQLKVIAPIVIILDDNGHAVSERHYKVDSSLHLTCRASHVDQFAEKVVWLKGDRALSATDSRVKIKVAKNDPDGEMNVQLSVLSLRKDDSGNYSCITGSLARYTVAVHVVNGELPAAVQHESGASVLLLSPAIWLSVLVYSASYGLLIPTVCQPVAFIQL